MVVDVMTKQPFTITERIKYDGRIEFTFQGARNLISTLIKMAQMQKINKYKNYRVVIEEVI